MEPLSWGTTHADLLTIHEVLRDDGFIVKDFDKKAYMEVKQLTQEFIDESLGYYINQKNRLMNSLLISSGLPGGMMGSLMSDLEKSHLSINKWLKKNKSDEINIDFLFSMLSDEVNEIWPKMGYPPLVTPYSQYVKNVALVNVLNKIKGKPRWSIIDDNTWDMLLGKSGKLPGKLGDEIIELASDLKKEFYTDHPQNLIEDTLKKNRKEMKDLGWSTGLDDEELLEYSLHRTQYIDYKSGKAKKNFNDDLEERRNESNSISDKPENKVEIIQIGSDKYKVEYSISEDISEKDLGVVDGNSVHSPIEGRFVLTKGSNDKPVKVNDVVKKGDVMLY